MNCTNCCPKGLDFAKAIVHLKEQVSEIYTDGWKNIMTSHITENTGTSAVGLIPAVSGMLGALFGRPLET
jgi:hypothetical protein